ncbi:MAG: DNA methyltransferase [Nanoarchaeota archaeon]|nr:DNA methyltransferase [Nanoarchaeota archaeon]
MEYLFILGRDPELSRQEIKYYLEARGIVFHVIENSDIAMILDLNTFNARNVIKELGGTQKIAQEIQKIDNLYKGKENKVRYGISNYTDEDDSEVKAEMKMYFKSEKIKALIKKSNLSPFLSPSEAQNVIEIILYNQKMYKTLAVFNPSDFKRRDENRPNWNTKHRISIRLAKILVNLSGAKPGKTLLDPFCGIGTIMQEAMLSNIDVIGISTDKQELISTKKNIDWLRKQYQVKSSFKLFPNIKAVRKTDYVATEPYLGPVLRTLPTEGEAKKTLKLLLPLYTRTIEDLGKITKRGAVFISPRFKAKSNKEFNLELTPVFNKAGFNVQSKIIYTAPKSKLIREIWVLRK